MKKGFLSRFGTMFLLMLVFFQQIGAGLYIHNTWHANKSRQSHAQHQEINITCNCVDHFLTPFIETIEPAIPEPVVAVAITEAVKPAKNYFFSPIVTALRGPPVFIG